MFPQVSGEWTFLQPMGSYPYGTNGHAVIYRSVTNEMIITGGNYDPYAPYLDECHSYNINTNTWEDLPPIPIALCYHSAIYNPVNDRMLIFGGSDGSIGVNTLYEFNFSTNQWSLLSTTGDVPSPRFFHSAAYNTETHSMIIYAGKYNPCNETYMLDLNTYVWELLTVTGDLPHETKFQSAVFDPLNESLIVFGGEENHYTFFNDTYVLDLNSRVWSHMDTTGEIPSKRSHQGYTYISSINQMVIFGGKESLWDRCNDTWFYDPQFDTWQLMDTSGVIPSPTSAGTIISVENMSEKFLLLFGGYNGSYTDELWKLEYDIELPNYCETTVNSINTCPGNATTSITVANIVNMIDFSLVLEYDTTNISYIGYQNFNAQLNDDSLSITENNGEIIMTWSSITPVTIISDTLIDLLFSATNVFNQTSNNLIWDDTNSYYSDTSEVNLVTIFNNGQFTINPIPANAGLIAGDDSICQGGGSLLYQIDSIYNADTYDWNLVPDSAGEVVGSDTIITVIFSESYIGEATLSVFGSNSCGDGMPSSLLIDVIANPISNAGNNGLICETENYILSGTASNCSHTYWNSFGDGIFDDPFLLNATYTPGSVDIQSGNTDIILFAYSINPCMGEIGDTMTLTIVQKPIVVAGENAEICEGELYLLSGYAENYSNILWITTGDGSFDNPELLTATYSPGDNDLSLGMVDLILTVYPNSPCISEENDSMVLFFNYLPEQPQIPDGPITIDLDITEISEYTTTSLTNTTSYEWFLNPSEAGVVEGNDTLGTVDWNSSYIGLSAYLYVMAGNECGEVSSDTLGISLSPVGIYDNTALDIIIYPNPSDGRFYVSFGSYTEEIELTVLNSSGKIVLKKKLQNNLRNTHHLDLFTIPEGIYYLKFVFNNRIEYRKVVLNSSFQY